MRHVTWVFAIATMALLDTSGAAAQSPARASLQAWEYREVKLDSAQSSLPLMNRLGSEGWELVNVVSACIEFNMQRDCEWWAYFKRPKP